MNKIIAINVEDIKSRNIIISAINYINNNKTNSDYKEWLLKYSFNKDIINNNTVVGFIDKYKYITSNLFNIPIDTFDDYNYNNNYTYFLYDSHKFIHKDLIPKEYTVFKADYDIGSYINKYGNKLAFTLNTIIKYNTYKLELNLVSKQFTIDYVLNSINNDCNKYIIIDLDNKLYFNGINSIYYKLYVISDSYIDYDKVFKIDININKYSIYSCIYNILEILNLKR